MLFKSQAPKPGLHIILVGCGKVGATIIEQLSKEGHDITVIDQNPQRIQEITGAYDVMGLTGNGASYSVQIEAGIEQADLLIAVTDSDELNLLCCTLAKQVGRCAAIARVRTPDYSKEVNYLREKLGLAMIINPELEAANEAAHILGLPTALEVNSFAHGQAEMIKFKIPKDNILDGLKIADLGSNITNNILMCVVERDGEVFIPKGHFILRHDDVVSFVSSRDDSRDFFEKIGFETNHVRNAMIIGGGKSTYYLAYQLLHMGIEVKIIEKDPARCEELSILLPDAIIINGDGTDQDLLLEEGIRHIESFIPLTGIDEENILLTLFAKQVSKAKVITKINRITFNDVVNSLDLGSVIYPRYITSEAIIAYVRAKTDSINSNIETLYHMFEHRVEAIEFKAELDSPVTNIPLKDLKIKTGILISCINRDGAIIIPSGQDCIMRGDTVIVVTTHAGFNDIQDILA